MRGIKELTIRRIINRIKKYKNSFGICHVFTGGLNGNGYGCIYHKTKMIAVHRYIYWYNYLKPKNISWNEFSNNTERCVCHKCDNPPCCNPKHLFLGSKKDNSIDMVVKGRHQNQSGENNPNVKLTTRQVLKIRRMQGSHTSISQKFDITPQAVYRIRKRLTWTDI